MGVGGEGRGRRGGERFGGRGGGEDRVGFGVSEYFVVVVTSITAD